MTQVLGILVLVVLPSRYFGRRVRKLCARQPGPCRRFSAIAAEVLNAIPGGAKLHAGGARGEALRASTEVRSLRRSGAAALRALLVAFIISATFGALLWGLYRARRR